MGVRERMENVSLPTLASGFSDVDAAFVLGKKKEEKGRGKRGGIKRKA